MQELKRELEMLSLGRNWSPWAELKGRSLGSWTPGQWGGGQVGLSRDIWALETLFLGWLLLSKGFSKPLLFSPLPPRHYVLSAWITTLLAQGGPLFFVHTQVKDLLSS